jgi:hypothetical protein
MFFIGESQEIDAAMKPMSPSLKEKLRRPIMTQKRMMRLIVTLVIVSITMSAVVSAATLTASGKINTVDFAKKKINIKLAGGKNLTLLVPASASIKRNGAAATLKGLGLRDDITVKYVSGKKVAASLNARGPNVTQRSGSLGAIDTRTGIIRIGLKSYRTSSNTKIARNGQLVSLNRLTRKDSVVLHVKPGTSSVRDILSCGPEEGEVEGTIAAIQPAANTITIAPRNATPAITLTVDANTIIKWNWHPATLAELRTNMRVEADYNLKTNVAFSIEADTVCQETKVRGTVKSVDTVAGALTVVPGDGGATVTLAVNAATEIEVNGAHALLANVQAGMPVTVEYHTLSLVAKEIEAGTDDSDCDSEKESDIIGKVSAVSSASITIVPKTGAPLTLRVDGSTKIEFDDSGKKHATIIDIPVGATVEAEYQVNTLLAREIEIHLDGNDDDCGDDDCGDEDCGDSDCDNDDCGDDDCGDEDCGDDDCSDDCDDDDSDDDDSDDDDLSRP